MLEIADVIKDSIADEMGLAKGDLILEINGEYINDYIAYQYITADERLDILVKKLNGEYWELNINRTPGEELGIIPSGIIYDDLKLCQNNCLFCFVKQQPSNMRESLMLRDDDYRFSFLQGSFITLTNLSDEEFGRIIELKLSPLNISVHTTNPSLRIEMMKNPAAGKIMEQLKKLAAAKVEFNTQIVLCKGINDGQELDRTISDLISLYPAVKSIGIVPVGLTKYRDKLSKLLSYDKVAAREVVKQVQNWQGLIKKRYSSNFLYCSDELYLLSTYKLPVYDDYNGFPQLENGIGLTRQLWQKFKSLTSTLPEKISDKKIIGIITGLLGAEALKPVVNRLKQINNLSVSLIPVKNDYFGQGVTVTGLLTGQDIIKRLKDIDIKEIIIPGIALNEEGFFLDDIRLEDIRKKYIDKNIYVCSNIEELVEVVSDG
ncbi:DUF512 domain-containing protein [Iocasia frigidifontis]|uniref:DUF512 domain-containing protein n=1 Tax=Iocasia fonsfrigidae TaxID=2682810 RepID=A0A8A7K8V5_9FIRM|nr:DUF512 domain-containing protein [Iocasia fonsfrigidae]QTL98233.1 DUF512 domain-containing protein [Iocasia fonsfrigidae]